MHTCSVHCINCFSPESLLISETLNLVIMVNPTGWRNTESDDDITNPVRQDRDHSSSSSSLQDKDNTSTNSHPTDGATFPSSLEYCFGANPLPHFNDAPSHKYFRVVKAAGVKKVRHDILCRKDDLVGFFKKVGTKFGIKRKEKICVEYKLKIRDSSSFEDHMITYDEDIEESMQLFYSLCPEFLEIEVSEVKKSSRQKRPVEKLGQKLSKHVVIDREYYRLITPVMATQYLRKVSYVQFVMGVADESTGNNLINITTYICHVKSCKRIVKLGYAGNIYGVITHWKQHKDESCDILIRRHSHNVRELGESPWKCANSWMDMDELEEKHDEGQKSLAIKPLMTDAFLAKRGLVFAGSSLMVNLAIMKKIAVNDPTALDSLQQQRSINEFLDRS